MGKVFDWLLGFVFVVLPVAVVVGLGFVYNWNFSRVITSFPNDPFAIGAVVFAGFYMTSVVLLANKALKISKAKSSE